MKKAATGNAIPDAIIQTVCERLRANERVRRSLPLWGRLHVDRQLPFLVVYRRPVVGADEGTYRLVTSEASHVFAPGIGPIQPSLASLVANVAGTLSDIFGGFLLVELSTGVFDSGGSVVEVNRPAFRALLPGTRALDDLEDIIQGALSKIQVRKLSARVDCTLRDRTGPRHLPTLMTKAKAASLGVTLMGLEVKPIHQDPKTGALYPMVMRDLERQLTRALRQVFFQFANLHTTHRPRHYHGLGRRAVVKAVWDVDKRLAAVSSAFDFLLQVTPENPLGAWRQFVKKKYAEVPTFRYRPLPVDPVQLKAKLYSIPIGRLEDPALRELFREKQLELDRRLTMLLDINTPRFVYGSLQLYGDVTDADVMLATTLLAKLSRRKKRNGEKKLTPAEFAERAELELTHYRNKLPDMKATVRIRDDTSGLMVSKGSLLVSRHSRIPESRVNALLQHEIGTHLVTYYNGKHQPFRQLASGLAGYEALQEGLGVFGEYMAGGLSTARLRTLAARVLGVRRMINGVPFVDVFSELVEDHRFDRRTAFTIAMRIFRGGGLTKDAIYLRGLVELLHYLRDGGRFDTLFLGKMAASQIPIIEELRWREVLRPATLAPRYMEYRTSAQRLAAARNGLELEDLTAGLETT